MQTATHCNTLQHTATHCNNKIATCCQTLQHAATFYNALQNTSTHRNTPQHTATNFQTLPQYQICRYGVLRCVAVCCGVLQCVAVPIRNEPCISAFQTLPQYQICHITHGRIRRIFNMQNIYLVCRIYTSASHLF